MIGCTLLTGPDVRGDFLSQESAQVLKALTGGDLVPAKIKRSNARFEIYGRFNAMITCNEALHIIVRNDRSAWARRLLIVHYDKAFNGQRITEVDKYLIKKEGNGVLAWCVEGAKMLCKDLQRKGDIELNSEQQARITKLLDESDSLRIFICGELVKCDGYDLSVPEIREAYFKYCAQREWNPIPFKDVDKKAEGLIGEYYQTLKSHSIKKDGKEVRGYHGLRFKLADEKDPDFES